MKVVNIALAFVLCLICFLNATNALAKQNATVVGKVVAVHDGDTLKILTSDKTEIKIRLSEIDAPEKDQPYGEKSKQALSKLVFGKNVVANVDAKDRYGRTVAHVLIDKVDVNQEMIKTGMAWVYHQYLKDKSLIGLEAKAREDKVGLWSLQEDQRIPPWEWRHGKKAELTKTQTAHSVFNINKGDQFSCGQKTYCKQMVSCEEASFYLHTCGLSRLDGDHDGVPCESLCK